MEKIHELCQYFSGSGLMWLSLTLLAFQIGAWIFSALGRRPVFNPVLIAVVIMACVLKVTGTDYDTYFKGSEFIHFLLGPATVALAIPLYKQSKIIKKSFIPIMTSLALGSLTGIVSAVAISRIFGGEKALTLSLAPKSITTPIAMAVSKQTGGLPSLTAVIVILTGISGAVIGDMILDRLKIKDETARGLAFGVAAHGIGTAHAIQAGQITGAFAGLAMGLNGLFTAVILPYIIGFIS